MPAETDERLVYEVFIRVSGRRELLADPQEVLDALRRGGYPADAVVNMSGCAAQHHRDFDIECEPEESRALRLAVGERLDQLDAGTCPRACGAVSLEQETR